MDIFPLKSRLLKAKPSQDATDKEPLKHMKQLNVLVVEQKTREILPENLKKVLNC
jgi:hypothetical protein